MSGASGVDMGIEVDARGMRCPWPVLRAAKALREHARIRVRADDPIAGRELQALAAERGWTFAVVEEHLFRLERS